jgi:hypothetical protein
VTARMMAQIIIGQNPQIDITKFSAGRFPD